MASVTAGKKQFAVVNTKMVIWPDKVYLDIKDQTVKPLAAELTGKLKITATPTEADDVVDKEYVAAVIPADTAADNGKVRGVVEGKLAWVTKA